MAENAVAVGVFVAAAALPLCVIRALKPAIEALSASKERLHTMFRELQHRVANNPQVASGVLHKVRKRLERDSPADRAL